MLCYDHTIDIANVNNGWQVYTKQVL